MPDRAAPGTRRLGSQGLVVSALGLGCHAFGGKYGPVDEAMAREIATTAVEVGVTLFDTAELYEASPGPPPVSGGNEVIVGRAIRPFRDRIQLASKFGLRFDDRGNLTVNGRPEYVKAACDASLKRLDTDHIDLYYAHRLDPDVPVEETVGAMAELVAEGKVRYLGLSEAAPELVTRAGAVHPISALQNEWSLWSREIEAEIAPFCRRQGIGIVPYVPLGRGMLTGTLHSRDQLSDSDTRLGAPRFRTGSFEANRRLVDQLIEIATGLSMSAAQLSLAWLLNHGSDVVPIPGANRPEHVRENAAIMHAELSDDVMASLDDIFAVGAATGSRHLDIVPDSIR